MTELEELVAVRAEYAALLEGVQNVLPRSLVASQTSHSRVPFLRGNRAVSVGSRIEFQSHIRGEPTTTP